MSMVGTFDGFTSARLGIYSAQHGLRVTGNNVSNINTLGYTRQRTDQVSFKVGANDMYRSFYDNHVGSGSLVTSISQLRDPYLDIRYRNTSTEAYHYDTWLAGLQGIASVLDEVGKGENDGDGLIYAQLQDLADKLRAYGNNPTSLNERLVRNSAESLIALFHTAADGLQKQFDETETEFTQNITRVNEILTSIRDLNASIRESEIHGDTALEMRDERNLLIDELSQYIDIKVQYSLEDVGAGIQVEKLTIKLNDANPDGNVWTDESLLVDGLYATQLKVPEEKPARNLFPDDSDYAYLNNFLYRREVTEDEAQKWLDNHPELNLTLADLVSKEEDGTPRIDTVTGDTLYLIGTDESDYDDIVTEKNDNYTIQLEKLKNAKGAVWKDTITKWSEVIDYANMIANTTFSCSVNIDYDTFKDLPNKNVTVYGVPVDLTSCQNEEDILNAIANALSTSAQFKDTYNVTSDGKNLIFEAKDGATTPPSLSLKPGEPDWLSVGTMSTIPTREYDEYGNLSNSVQYVQSENGQWYRLEINNKYTHEVTLDDNDLRGILQAERELLTEEGEFSSTRDVALDENALTKRGIPYYQQSLDLLAQKFAQAYNQLNQGYAYNQDGYYIKENGDEILMEGVDENGVTVPAHHISAIDGLSEDQKRNMLNNHIFLQDEAGYAIDENGNRITDKDGNYITKDTDMTTLSSEDRDKLVVDLNTWLQANDGIPMGGALFTTNGDDPNASTIGINASNISISYAWSNGATEVIRTFEMLFVQDGSGTLTNSTQPSNINHMISMIENSLTYNPNDLYGSDAIGPELFKGNFNDMLSNMMATEAEDASITNTRLTTAAGTLSEIDYSRDGVSGVDLNDEAMNMITYQKAMTAAMRVMTTLDEMLDRLINNTGIT